MSMRRSPQGQEEVGGPSVSLDSAQKGRRKSTSMGRRIALLLGAVLFVAGIAHFFHSADTSDSLSFANQIQQHEYVRKRSTDNDSSNGCTIYMAPSSLKGNGGNGIFTTRDIARGSTMLSGPDGPSIPVVDYRSGRWTKTWNEYWWQRGVADHVTYEVEGDGYVMDYQFGFGSMPNQ